MNNGEQEVECNKIIPKRLEITDYGNHEYSKLILSTMGI